MGKGKKEQKGEIKQFVKKQVDAVSGGIEITDARAHMTEAEMIAYQEMEEAEINAHLGKFASVMPNADSSGVTDDEEDEILTLDFENMTATEVIEEGVLVRHEDGTVEKVTDEKIIDRVKEVLQPVKAEPTAQQMYQNMITDRFVSKAIASLIEKYVALDKATYESVDSILPLAMSEAMGIELSKAITKKKHELKAAIAGGNVHYDKIPSWAEGYINDSIFTSLNTLIDFVERD